MIGKNSGLRLLLIASLLVQLTICVTAVGVYHPDQHFQIIEFSSYQLHRPSAVGQVWEFTAQMRSTLQVYLFSGWLKACLALSIQDPYLQLALLRTAFGLVLFVFFNWMTIRYLRDQPGWVLYVALFILNFSWILPYTRTLFSSEMLSSLFLFGAIALYEGMGSAGRRFWQAPLVAGFLFSLAFYTRFQTEFAMLGFLLWMLLAERKPGRLLPLALGFALGCVLNTALDYGFYHQLVFTPWTYFKVNIIDGKAASMGTASFLLYIGALVLMVLAPPLSIFLLYAGFRTALLKKYNRPLVAAVIFFILGHCLVAHKEERFLFPIVNVLPIFVGWGLPGLVSWWERRRKVTRYLLKALIVFSVGVNCIVLVILCITPYSQSLYFTALLKREFHGRPVTIYSLRRTPFETEHGLSFQFYLNGTGNLQWKEVATDHAADVVDDSTTWLTATFDQVKDKRQWLDSAGYQQVMCSSVLLWRLNEFLDSKKVNTINDIWALYQKKDDRAHATGNR